jgi:hypothetical protein
MKIIEAALLANLANPFHLEPVYVELGDSAMNPTFQKDALESADKANAKDPKDPASVWFDRDYDHMGYDHQAILNDMGRIKIVKTKEALD